MKFRVKPTVDICGLKPETLFCHGIVLNVFGELGHDCIVTSVNDSRHGYKSLHYQGYALDYRSWHIPDAGQKETVVQIVRSRYPGPDMEFYYEPDALDAEGKIIRREHFHLEYQRKRR